MTDTIPSLPVSNGTPMTPGIKVVGSAHAGIQRVVPDDGLTVSELIAVLQEMPQHLPVAFKCCSEQVLLRKSELEIVDACLPRPDGWIQDKRPDKPTTQYLLFPGN